MKKGVNLFEEVLGDRAVSLIDETRYQAMIDEAAAEYATANREYQDVAAAAREAEADLDELEAEVEAIRNRIASFEAGRVSLTEEEFVQLEDRRRFLGIRIKHKAAEAKTARDRVQLVAEGPRGVSSKYYGRLNDMTRKDFDTFAKEMRARLESVLRG